MRRHLPYLLASLVLGPFALAGSPDAVVVFNEIQYNPRGIAEDGEWIEVFNQMGIKTDVSGWRIQGVDYTFPAGTVIDPGGYLVVYKTPGPGQLGPYAGSLDNDGELIALINQGDRLMDELDYGDSGRWPVEADGSGATLAKRRPYTANKPVERWTFSKQDGGTPGAINFPGGNLDVLPEIRINEMPALSATNFWIELINAGSSEVEIGGIRVSVDGDPAREFLIPAQALAAGALLLLDEAALGFRPADTENVFLYDATGILVLDGQRQTGRLRGRSGLHDGAWLYPDSPSPGLSNVFTFHDEVVISEIAYNPPAPQPVTANSDNQWIELANRGTVPVDLAGWNFGDGLNFTFPTNTVLGVGEQACIARDAAAFTNAFPAARLLGEFGGSLSRRGEHLLLRDANDNPADELSYFDGGRWPEAPDGDGSSLELRDLDADNNDPASWAASDETAQSSWTNYSYSGTAAASRGPDTKWSEFNMGLLDAGEILIDDIHVVENGSIEKLSNTDFSSGAAGWRFRGTHRHSEIIDDPESPGNKVLRLVATGSTGHMHNQIESTLLSTVNNGQNYTISFRARWVSGSNQLHTRLYFNRLPRVTLIDRPEHVGTPSAPNSRAEPNIGPSITEAIHAPAVPAVNEAVTVSARVADPDGVTTVQLFYAVNGGAFQAVPMSAGADGIHQGSIPGQAAEAVVQFYIEGSDGLGAVATFPAAGPDSRALYKVEDGLAATNGQHNLRIVVTNAERDFMHEPIEVMSNGRIGATVIDREQEIYYDAQLRLKGSQRARNQTNRVGYNLRFGADQPYRGIHQSLAIDRSQGQVPGQLELLFDIMTANSGGVISRYYDFIKVLAPKNQHTGSATLQLARYDDVFLDSQFENGSDGNLYEYELLYTPNTADGNGFKLPQPDGVNGVPVSDLGEDQELYRWFYLKKNNRKADDFAPIIAYNKKFSQNGAAFEDGLEDVVDIDAWFRGMAYGVLSGAGDNAAAGSAHNGMYYARPDGRVMFLPHDMDFSFSTSRSIFANPECAKLTQDVSRRRIYLGHLHDIISTTYNSSYMSMWTDHLASLDPAQNWTSHLGFIGSRSANVLGQISGSIPQVSFGISSPDPLVVNGSTAIISGEGWVDVRGIRLAGGPELEIRWTDGNSWEVEVPVFPGTNTVMVEAFTFSGELAGAGSITVENTSAVEPASSNNLAVTEFLYHPSAPTAAEISAGYVDDDDFEYIEVMNIGPRQVNLEGVAFTGGIQVAFPSLLMAAGSRLVFSRNRLAFQSRHPGIIPGLLRTGYGIGDANQLSNKSEEIVLSDILGADIRRFTYFDDLPWPTSADGAGFSLVLVAPGSNPDHSLPENWRSSGAVGGTPGTDGAIAFSGDPLADDDGDGLNNFVDHALGDSGVPSISRESEETFIYQFHRNLLAEDALLSLESSGNLVDWSAAGLTLRSAVSIGGGLELQTWEVDASSVSLMYLRMTATQR